MNYQKIVIVGCGGSGKTYLSLKLAQKLQLPLYHLDQYYWQPDWQRLGLERFISIHQKLCEQDAWIIEGSYIKLLHERAKHADFVIFLDIPRYQCLWNVIKRAITNYGCEISGSPAGCKQKIFTKEFLYFLIWIWNFNARYRTMILEILNEYKTSKKIYILKSAQEMNEFMK